MSAPEPSKGQADRERLDLLVDGELEEAERHELLTRLDGQPDGWRRCAMAFLEAQCWRQECTDFLGKAAVAAPPPQGRAIPAPGRRERRLVERAATPLAMAASFVIALGLGWMVQGMRRTGPAPALLPEPIAQSGLDAQTAEPANPPTPERPQRPVAPRSPWQMVTLAANGPDGDRGQTIHLPACEQQHLDRHWPGGLPSALPCDLLESLQRAGYRVRRHRELLPVDMQDGRRLVVPVEQVEVEYVGRPPL